MKTRATSANTFAKKLQKAGSLYADVKKIEQDCKKLNIDKGKIEPARYIALLLKGKNGATK